MPFLAAAFFTLTLMAGLAVIATMVSANSRRIADALMMRRPTPVRLRSPRLAEAAADNVIPFPRAMRVTLPPRLAA